MTPLMQTICDELRLCGLDPYIDAFQRDIYTQELNCLHKALSAVLPESCQELLVRYTQTLNARALLETEAMFQAAFAAAKELA